MFATPRHPSAPCRSFCRALMRRARFWATGIERRWSVASGNQGTASVPPPPSTTRLSFAGPLDRCASAAGITNAKTATAGTAICSLIMSALTRRELMRLAVTLPIGALFLRYRALAAPYRNQVKITGIKAMGMKDAAGNCLIRIDTDSGLTGYGEAGATGAMARARIETMKPLLIGQDPLAIERHFQNMTSLMHTYMAHIPTISGIDMALWDLAGKITARPVCVLLGGP